MQMASNQFLPASTIIVHCSRFGPQEAEPHSFALEKNLGLKQWALAKLFFGEWRMRLIEANVAVRARTRSQSLLFRALRTRGSRLEVEEEAPVDGVEYGYNLDCI